MGAGLARAGQSRKGMRCKGNIGLAESVAAHLSATSPQPVRHECGMIQDGLRSGTRRCIWCSHSSEERQ